MTTNATIAMDENGTLFVRTVANWERLPLTGAGILESPIFEGRVKRPFWAVDFYSVNTEELFANLTEYRNSVE